MSWWSKRSKTKEPTTEGRGHRAPGPDVGKNIETEEKDMHEFYGEVIYAYTRAEALEDGVLVDVSETAKEAGFVVPVAVTAALWSDINDVPEASGQDPEGRLWDVLWMGRFAAGRRSAVARQERHLRGEAEAEGPELVYALFMGVGSGADVVTNYRVKSVIGPGDEGEPVITLMRPEES